MSETSSDLLFDRELSWLSFNARVLQEAENPNVPLFERLHFLAIFSSNLDEFFRVRVASLRSLLRLKKKKIKKLDFDPAALLDQIVKVVTAQQETYGTILREEVLPGLAEHGIHLIDEKHLEEHQHEKLRTFFWEDVAPHLDPVLIERAEEPPFLENNALYLVTELWERTGGISFSTTEVRYALVKVPSPPLQRFVRVPADGEDEHYVMFLDDLVRHFLPDLFPAYDVGKAYAIKLSRDADLYLEDEFSGNLKEMIEKSLSKRKTGTPTRFLYDQRMPQSTLSFLKQRLDIAEEDVIEGWRYHNLNDFFSFPRFGRDDLAYEPMPPLPHPEMDALPSIMAAIREHDRLLHVPYQSFDYVIRFLEEAAEDPDVEGLWITLYRIADDSAVAKALVRAAEQGKQVTAFVEAKARFDEATNLRWAERMEEAGVNVLYSMPGIKVHSKLALVARREDEACAYYAYLGTGNFNEETARVYSDLAVLTADPRLCEEVRKVFAFLEKEDEEPTFEHLLMAPLYLRDAFNRLIDREIENAEAGKDAWILAKMNSLEDPNIIERLYKASQAGVKVRMIVRGFSCLVPGVEGVSENITITSIVDRFLEHARVYVFCNDGDEELYLASADWMKRNLNRRVEVAFPLYDPALIREVRTLLDFQLADNVRARLIDEQQTNPFVENDDEPVRSQFATYEHFKNKVEHPIEASG